jgi:hypothetical protein
LHPGVRRRGKDIVVDPVIGVENVTLRERLLSADKRWEGSTSVCHVYLGILASWNRFYLRTDDQLDDAAKQIIRSVIDVGLPVMSEYDTLDKVRKLFQEDIAHTKRSKIVVLFAPQKLELIDLH